MPRHQDPAVLLGDRDELLHLRARQSRRLLDQDVLPRFEGASRQLRVCHHRRRDDDRVERLVREQLVEVGGRPGRRIPAREPLPLLVREIAEPRELGELIEVPREVRAPVAEPGEADFRHGESLTSTSAMRSEAWPSPYSRGRGLGIRALEIASTIASGSSRTSRFAPASTVSVHSVVSRSVTHGTPCQYASFCKPPESVAMTLACEASAVKSR